MKGSNGTPPKDLENPHLHGQELVRAMNQRIRDEAREDAANARAHQRSLDNIESQNNARLNKGRKKGY